MGRPKKAQPGSNLNTPPMFATSGASPLPSSEETLDDSNAICDAIQEVAFSFQALTETLGRIFLQKSAPVPPSVQIEQSAPRVSPQAAMAPQTTPLQIGMQPIQQAPPQMQPIQQAPPPQPIQQAPPPQATGYTDQDLQTIYNGIKGMGVNPTVKGTEYAAKTVVDYLQQSLPNLSPEALWQIILRIGSIQDPAQAVLQVFPPDPSPLDGSPARPAIVKIL